MKRYLLPFLFIILLVGELGLPLARANHALAASFDPSQDQHLDRSLILFQGHEFYDGQIDDTYSYTRTDDSDGCPDVIDNLTNNNTKATLHTKTKNSINGGCDDARSSVALAHPERADMPFVYIDIAHIKTSDGKTSYTKNDSVGMFLEDGGDNCKDFLKVVKGGPEADSATVAVTASTGGKNTAYKLWADELAFEAVVHGNITNGGNGCKNYGPQNYQVSTVFISNPQLANPASSAGSSSNPSDPNANPSISCENKLGLGDIFNIGKGINWLVCTAIRAANGAINQFDKIIRSQLEFQSSALNDSYYQAWSAFRYIAVGLLVLVGLTMVISQMIGIGLFDAYTVKKLLPRMFVAAILITLSWTLCKIAIDAINLIGGATNSLIYAPFGGASGIQTQLNNVISTNTAGSNLAFAGAAIGGYFAIATTNFLVILTFALPALIAVAVGLVLVILRQVVIVLMVIIAPLAVVAYILPGTDKVWKFWRENFFRALIMYPLIIAFLSIGKVFALITLQGDHDLVHEIIALVAYFGPYLAIPATFKLAGGVLGSAHGLINNKSSGLLDKNRKFRQGQQAKTFAKSRNYSRFSDKNRLGRGINTALGAGLNPRNITRGKAGIQAGRQAGRAMQGADVFKSDKVWQANQKDDNFLLALANEGLAQQMYDKALANYNTAKASGDNEGKLKYQREMDARAKGLNAAKQVASRGSAATRLAALNQLSQTGYQFAVGEAGYKQLSDTVRSITGNDEGAYAAYMDEAQYHLKSASRFDLGGINHGTGYDTKVGLDKAGLYQIANGKKESITAMGTHYGGRLADAKSGVTTNPDGSVRTLSAAEVDERYMDAAITEKELDAMLPNATGAVRDEILEQRQQLLSTGGKEFEDWKKRLSGERMEFTNPTTGAKTLGRQYEMSEVAGRRARNYERPDPNKIP